MARIKASSFVMPLQPARLLKHHPLPMEAHFEFVLVLAYALPAGLLEAMLPPGLTVDRDGDSGFVAVAFVKTKHMRIRGMPEFLGKDFFLVGYRIFSRYTTHAGRRLRGLKILRSDADRRLMVGLGNLFTHYNYHLIEVEYNKTDQKIHLNVGSNDLGSDVVLDASLDAGDTHLPPGSPFGSVREALKFAGPMPFTFDYEEESDSIIRVEGVRQNWTPRPVAVDVKKLSFLEQGPFLEEEPVLSSAFWIENVPYNWKPGVCERLRPEQKAAASATGGQDPQ